MSIGIVIGLFWGTVIGVLAMGMLASGRMSDLENEIWRLKNAHWERVNGHIQKRQKCQVS